ncbi:hypothetical protein ACFX13_011270 [Malus domestica]
MKIWDASLVLSKRWLVVLPANSNFINQNSYRQWQQEKVAATRREEVQAQKMATRHTWYILSSKQEYDCVTGTLERNVLLPSWAAKGPLNVESKIYWTGGTNWVGPQQLSNWKFETENPKPTTVRERAVTATISCLVKQQPWRFSAKRITGHPVPGTKLTSQSGSQTNE